MKSVFIGYFIGNKRKVKFHKKEKKNYSVVMKLNRIFALNFFRKRSIPSGHMRSK